MMLDYFVNYLFRNDRMQKRVREAFQKPPTC